MTDSSAWLLEEQLSLARRKNVMGRPFDRRRGILMVFIGVGMISTVALNYLSRPAIT